MDDSSSSDSSSTSTGEGGDMQLVSFPIFWIFLSLPPAIFPLDLSTSPSYLPTSTLQHAASLINQTLTRITKKWEISSYPSFLSSSYIPSSSWDAMKYKFLSHLSTPNSTFVISFLGGGSTAGYDISSDHVFHILLDEIMKPIFHHINLPLVIRNVGMGGNLCTPYGLCVRTLAGDDADIILWENTFDCGFPECGFILEQFVRQALSSPSHPILAFGSSHFPNWSPTIWETRLIHLCRKTKSCKEINMRPKPPLSNDYDAILQRWQAKGLSAVTHENTQVRMKFDHLGDIYPKYDEFAKFQFWDHSHYSDFSCRGPYFPYWSEGVAPWHPSTFAHELRADQLAFFWLSILEESLSELLKSSVAVSLPSDFRSIFYFTISPIFRSNISSSVQCFTNYEPRASVNSSISSLLLLEDSTQKWEGWYAIVAEDPEMILQRVPFGLTDLKYSIYGSAKSGPLSLKLDLTTSGYIFLCEPPGVKRKFLPDLIHLWSSEMKLYLTSFGRNEQVYPTRFKFDSIHAKELNYFYSPCDDGCVRQGLCMQVDGRINAGRHVLTIIPTKEERIILSTLFIANL